VRSLTDTPSLIQFLASDAGNLILCRTLVNESCSENHEFSQTLRSACREREPDFAILQEKLIPAATALGLTLSPDLQLDYYTLLGINPEADAEEIKKAFREKAYKSHPDTREKGSGDSEKFIRLTTAYQTLSDPILRRHYNLSRRNLSRWHEMPVQDHTTNRHAKASFVIQLGIIIVLLVLGIFVFDLLVP
jgi:hypothetical protein